MAATDAPELDQLARRGTTRHAPPFELCRDTGWSTATASHHLGILLPAVPTGPDEAGRAYRTADLGASLAASPEAQRDWIQPGCLPTITDRSTAGKQPTT